MLESDPRVGVDQGDPSTSGNGGGYAMAGLSPDTNQPVYQGPDGQLYSRNPDGSYAPYTGTPPGAGGRSGNPPQEPGPTVPAGPGAPAPATGGGGGGINTGSLTAPFNQPFTPPTPAPLPNAPTVPTIPAFTAPTLSEAMNDPGYAFSYNQGADQLKNWLAAHGTFNDSAGAQSLINYGQNAAQTQYNNVWSRDLNAYTTNTQTQYTDPFNEAFQNYSTTAPLVQHSNDINWQNAFNSWMQNWNIFKDQRDSTFDKQFKVATS